MIRPLLLITLLLVPAIRAAEVDIDAFGESLGGWTKGSASYELSGSDYRTYKPEISPTPDGGLFVSVRIDHRRGWLASDDHAMLEVSFGPDGSVVSAQSTLAIQGRTISSDLIRSTADAGAVVTGIEGAVRIGANLVSDLSSKLLREKIVEAGRVSFPAAVRHNYNLLFRAVGPGADDPAPAGSPEPSDDGEPEPEPSKEDETPDKKRPDLKIQPYGREPK